MANELLTADEVVAICKAEFRKTETWSECVVSPMDMAIARAIESSVLAKLGEQEPVAEVVSNFGIVWAGSEPIAPLIEKRGIKVGDHLYTRPAPVQGAVPEEWQQLVTEMRDKLVVLIAGHADQADEAEAADLACRAEVLLTQEGGR